MYAIREYPLEQGALEIAFIEEHFNDFPQRKTAVEIEQRLAGRESQILMAEAPLPEDPTRGSGRSTGRSRSGARRMASGRA